MAASSWYCVALLLLGPTAAAAESTPELQRPTGAPQAIGTPHTLRQIPEACARLEGVFTGQAAEPYRFSVVRSSPELPAAGALRRLICRRRRTWPRAGNSTM